MEACGTAHYWEREIAALGYEVRLIPPAYVKPFVKRGKTDAVDAEAIGEAVTRKTMRFVPAKKSRQQAATMVLKTRARLVRQRTQAVNALRAHLAELGIIAAVGMAKIAALVAIVREETDARLPPAARFALMAVVDQIDALAGQSIVTEAKRDEDMRRLTTIPGVGAITAATITSGRGATSRHGWIGAKTPFQRRQRAVGAHLKDGQSRTSHSPGHRGDVGPADCPQRRSRATVG